MLSWPPRHGFCAACGALTRAGEGGHLRRCLNPDCGAQHFPRTDPAVIMLVTHEGRTLLGRNPSWANGLYSTLAGCRWFPRAGLEPAGDWLAEKSLAEAGDGSVRLPRADSLARRLIDDWLR